MTLAERPCDLRNLVGTAVEKAVQESSTGFATIENAVAEGLPPLDVDATRLGRAIEHLIANALAATPADGKVTVSAERDENNRFCIDIRDTGAGIPPEKLAQVMQPLSTGGVKWQNHSEGAGLGLTYARVVSQLHGGGLEMDSTPGTGTLVSIWLPSGRMQTA